MGVDRLAFGRLIKQHRKARKMSLGLLGIRIGELSDGTYLDSTGVRNLEEGRRAIEDDPELYERVVIVLELDRDEAHAALWPLPEGITLDDIRELRRDSGHRATRRMTAAGRVASPRGGSSAAPHSATDQAIDDKRTCLELAGIAA